MDLIFPSNRIPAGRRVQRLPRGRTLRLRIDGLTLGDVMRRDRLEGILVLQHGTIRLEAYGLHASPQTRWTSFSVAKSITSTLVGVAIAQGAIQSLNDPLTQYLPELRDTAYDGVNVRQLLTMTTGVRWVEDYTAPESDNIRLYQTVVPPGGDAVVAYLATLPRAHPPGSVWNYNTGEADLAGVLVRRALQINSLQDNVGAAATKRLAEPAKRRSASGPTLSALLSQTIWRPFGMEREATWIADGGREFGGSGISATLRDYGRFGLFALAGGGGAVPGDWFHLATQTVKGSEANGRGYGMGWWTYADGSYAALGIFGQSLLVDPQRDLVVVMLGAWPHATDPALAASRTAIWQAVDAALDSGSE